MLFANAAVAGVRQHEVAALRDAATASTAAAAPRRFIVKSSDPRCDPTAGRRRELADDQPYCLPKQVAWAAPTCSSRRCATHAQQLTQIITYGRPGTPMPAWGVAERQGRAQDAEHPGPRELRREPRHHVRQGAGRGRRKEVDELHRAAPRASGASSSRTRRRRRRRPSGSPTPRPSSTPPRRCLATPGVQDVADVHQARAAEAGDPAGRARTGRRPRSPRPTAQLLFMNNCARCHTRGWSYFDPTDPGANPPPGSWAAAPTAPTSPAAT